MNQEPETLTKEELLRVENIQLKRELLNQMDGALVRDIAHARMLNVADYGKTWVVDSGRIHQIATAGKTAEVEELANA